MIYMEIETALIYEGERYFSRTRGDVVLLIQPNFVRYVVVKAEELKKRFILLGEL